MFNLVAETNKKSLSVTWELNEHKEKLIASVATLSRNGYISQWISAVRMILEFHVPAPIFLNVEVNRDNLGRLWCLNLNPISDHKEEIYITQQFMHITTKIENLRDPVPLIEAPRTPYDYATLFFLDINNIERIYPYLSYGPSDVSSWSATKSDIADLHQRLYAANTPH